MSLIYTLHIFEQYVYTHTYFFFLLSFSGWFLSGRCGSRSFCCISIWHNAMLTMDFVSSPTQRRNYLPALCADAAHHSERSRLPERSLVAFCSNFFPKFPSLTVWKRFECQTRSKWRSDLNDDNGTRQRKTRHGKHSLTRAPWPGGKDAKSPGCNSTFWLPPLGTYCNSVWLHVFYSFLFQGFFGKVKKNWRTWRTCEESIENSEAMESLIHVTNVLYVYIQLSVYINVIFPCVMSSFETVFKPPAFAKVLALKHGTSGPTVAEPSRTKTSGRRGTWNVNWTNWTRGVVVHFSTFFPHPF